MNNDLFREGHGSGFSPWWEIFRCVGVKIEDECEEGETDTIDTVISVYEDEPWPKPDYQGPNYLAILKFKDNSYCFLSCSYGFENESLNNGYVKFACNLFELCQFVSNQDLKCLGMNKDGTKFDKLVFHDPLELSWRDGRL